MGYARIQAKSGTQYGLEHSRKVLKERELAFVYPDEIGKGNAKVVCGDGETIMCDLPFVLGDDAADMQVSHIDNGDISLLTEDGEPLLTEDDEYLLVEEDYYETAEIVAGLRLSELFAIVRAQINVKGDMKQSIYDPAGGKSQVAFKRDLETFEMDIQASLDTLKTSINSQLTNGSVTKLGTATVGSTTKFIYLDNGSPVASSATVGSGTKLMYLSNGALTESTSTVGGTARGMYLNAGTLTALSATVGSGTQPVYMSNGTITACGTSVGGTAKPIYSNAGVLTALSDTIGGTAKPIYVDAGTLKALTSTVGSASRPIYLNSGTLTQCNEMVPVAGATMTGQLIGYASTNYTTAQFRNIIFATSLPSSGNNGDVCFIYKS